MINNKELQIANTSYTKKDFYQLYPEILDLVKKISNRYDPSSSNESDVGVVLFKSLAYIADHTNYNLDKTILERFMPSASQEESMRELCDTVGYRMKYYQSATTTISFMYQGSDLTSSTSFTLNAFDTVVSNSNDDVEYILTSPVTIAEKNKTYTASAIEGTLCDALAGDSSIIKLNNLDDSNRFYLPEEMIAENGVFITNVSDDTNNFWDRVDNLNSIQSGKNVWKFGYDSQKSLPYIEFPEDIATLIGSGLYIKYIRTTGANGNVSAKTLDTLKGHNSVDISLDPVNNVPVLVIQNINASTNGTNKETIDEAYNNFKKTVGTFDTLVTCRDYANKIYQLVASDNTTPLVSNVQVADIRDDINNSVNIVSYKGDGVYTTNFSINPTTFNNFDLELYPYQPITTSYTKTSYINSFKPETNNLSAIKAKLKDYKTISHNLISPNTNDIYTLKSYYDLKAKITTTYKVNETEQKEILSNIYSKLYNTFNMREVDFGEKLPFDTLLSTIQNADTRIKNVSLDEPDITMKYALKDGTENLLVGSDKYTFLLAKNILAGRLALFNYDTRVNYYYGQTKISDFTNVVYGNKTDEKLVKMTSHFKLPLTAGVLASPYTLKAHEAIQFMAPNFRTTITYPVYVNYHFIKADKTSPVAINADYKLANGDELYLNYTNSDDEVITIRYTYNKIYTKTGSGAWSEKNASDAGNIIRPNFALYDTDTDHASTGKTYTKTIDVGDNVKYGFYTLSSSEQIEIRDLVKTTLNSNTKCYWLTDTGTIFSSGVDEYILKDNEYFFYTNDAETELVTLGSGTKLIRHNDSVNSYSIDYGEESKLSADDVVSKGLAAFSGVNWKTLKLTASTTTNGSSLDLQEMQYITLTEGDTLNSLTLVDTTLTNLDNSFNDVSNTTAGVPLAGYTLSGSSLTTLNAIPANLTWKVKSRLDFNVGPELSQTLTDSYDSVVFTFNNGTSDSTKELDGAVNVNNSFQSNYLIQCAGGEVSTKVIDFQEEEINDFTISVFNIETPTDDKSTALKITASIKDYTTIYLTNLNSYITLPITIPSDDFGIFMVYYNNLNNLTTGKPKLTSTNDMQRINSSDAKVTAGSDLVLNDGVNIIKVFYSSASSTKITITKVTSSDTGNLVLGSLRNVYSVNSGVNTSVLFPSVLFPNETDLATKATDLLTEIKTLDTQNLFYYNCPIDNSNLIDSDDMTDPNAWYDYNNVCNKFVISELNVLPDGSTVFPYIVIAKGSKL